MNIAIAEDHPIFRKSMARTLDEIGADVLINVGTVNELLEQLDKTPVDVVLLDVYFGHDNPEGLEAAGCIRELYPDIPVLLMSGFMFSEQAFDVIRTYEGRVGYVSKERMEDEWGLKKDLERLIGGDAVLDPSMIMDFISKKHTSTALAKLSETESMTLELMAQGYSNTAIAEYLCKSHRTVENHVSSIFLKLGLGSESNASEQGVHRRVQAVLEWLKHHEPSAAAPS